MSNINNEEEEQQQQGSSNHPACASCKYQRRRCKPDCIISPHFPADRADDFMSVQRIFGVKTLTRMLKDAKTDQARHTIVESMVWEARMWTQDTVHGPYGEYNRIVNELNMYRNIIEAQKQHQQRSFMMAGTISSGHPDGLLIPGPRHINTSDSNMMMMNNGYGIGGGGVGFAASYPNHCVLVNGDRRMIGNGGLQEAFQSGLLRNNQQQSGHGRTTSFFNAPLRINEMSNGVGASSTSTSDQSMSNSSNNIGNQNQNQEINQRGLNVTSDDIKNNVPTLGTIYNSNGLHGR